MSLSEMLGHILGQKWLQVVSNAVWSPLLGCVHHEGLPPYWVAEVRLRPLLVMGKERSSLMPLTPLGHSYKVCQSTLPDQWSASISIFMEDSAWAEP